MSCNSRHQSTPIPLPRPRLASATNSLNSLVDIEPFRLPDFWYSNVRGYFQTAEILFDHANVSDEVTEYAKLLDSLQKNHAVFPKITDIVQNIPNDRPYSSLKAFLSKKYSSTTSDSVSALLHTRRRGDHSVLDYFQRLNSFAPAIIDLVFSVFTSNFVILSYKISLLKNRFVTLFFIRFS